MPTLRLALWLLLAATLAGAPAYGQSGAITVQASRTGPGMFLPLRWAQAGVTIGNQTAQAQELQLLCTVGDQPDTEFAMSVWVPARCARRVAPLIRTVAAQGNEKSQRVAIRVLPPPGATTLKPVIESGFVSLNHEAPTTGLLMVPDDHLTGRLLSAAKSAAGWGTRFSYMGVHDLPADPAGLATLDALIVARDMPEISAAQVSAVRRWMLAGGRLWVMAPRVSPVFLTRLLGDDCRFETLDRVELDRVEFQGERRSRPRDLDRPVSLTRVLTHGMEVLAQANGWPAALRRDIGRGRLIVTLLDLEGWMDERGVSDAMVDLAAQALSAPTTSAEPEAQAMLPPVMGQIGYRIAGRGWIITMLSGYVGLLVVVGLGLMRFRKLELLPLVGVGLAVGAVVIMIGVGRRQRQEVPTTLAVQQVVDVTPSGTAASVQGTLALFTPGEGDPPLHGKGVLPVLPEWAGDARIHQLETLDMDRWRWTAVTARSGGVRLARFGDGVTLPHPLRARMAMDALGMVGRIDAADGTVLKDLDLFGPGGRMILTHEPDGTLRLNAGKPIWSGASRPAGSATSDAELRQRRLIDALCQARGSPAAAHLVGWSEGIDSGFDLGPGVHLGQAAIVFVPVELDRPAAGATFALPAAMLMPKSPNRRGAKASGSLFDPVHRRWSAHAGLPFSGPIAFQAPRDLLPLRFVSGRLWLKLDAPGRRVEVALPRSAEPVARFEGPRGEVVVELPAGSPIDFTPDGAIALQISIGEAPAGPARANWTLHDACLEAVAQTLPR